MKEQMPSDVEILKHNSDLISRVAASKGVYPDLHVDTVPELMKKRDAITLLISYGYQLQPELNRVNKRIKELVHVDEVM